MEVKQTQQDSKFSLFIKTNYSILQKIVYFCFVFLSIFMFVMLMLPTSAAHSQTNFVNQTSFYSVKYSADFSNYYISLSPGGIILIILLLLLIMFSLPVFIINRNEIINKYKELDETNKKKYLIKNILIYSTLAFLLLLFLIFNLVPPNFSEVSKYYYIQNIKSNVDPTNPDSIVQALKTLGYTSINGVDINSAATSLSIGVLRDFLTTKAVFKQTFMFTWFANFNSRVTQTTNVIYLVVVFFVFFLSFSLFTGLGFYLANKNFKFFNLFSKERLAKTKEKIKAKQKERKEISQTKKELNQRENELLRNLYEVNEDKIKQEKKMGIISQEELEIKLSKNNEIKKQLDDLIQQKALIQKQKIANSKIKSALHKSQDQNKPRKDKQKITIPDKELDEIFRNLEID